MTEELANVIVNLTCRTCNGEGRLFSHYAQTQPGGVLVNHDTDRPCNICAGLGFRIHGSEG